MSCWGKKLAEIWTNNVAPSRPSNSELCVYNKYLRIVQKRLNRPVELLVLGSTPEFRDWGFEQDLNISVVDENESYFNMITREIRHKNLRENLYITRWESMEFDKKFDIIIGDLTIGNLEPSRFNEFLIRIKNCLSAEGLFIGKSFLWDENEKVITPSEIIENYKNSIKIHPYTYINSQLGLFCLDRENYLIDFQKMYNELEKLNVKGELSDELFSYFKDIGWNTEMKFKFFSPSKSFFVKSVNKELHFVRYEYTDEIYTNVFPIYIIELKGKFL